MSNLFTSIEQVLVSAKESKITQKELFKYVRPIIRNYCLYIVNKNLWLACDLDDLEQVGLIQFWKYFNKYKFICPICGVKKETNERYAAHLFAEHDVEHCHTNVNISSWISWRMSGYIKTYVRDLRAGKRDGIKTVMFDFSYDIDLISGFDDFPRQTFKFPEDALISRQRHQLLLDLLEQETNGRIKVAMQAWLEGLKNQDVYQRLVDCGFYKNRHCAYTRIAKMIRSGHFDKYRKALSA